MEAWDVVLCRTVALKILRNLEPTSLIRFMHEAQIQARLAHPNICRIYDVDSSEGTVKIAMQLVRGPNLEQVCQELTQPEVVTLMAQVAEAIQAAHSLKLIHRDLKPSNILLEKGGNGRWVPYICDFGLAMALDEPALTYSNGIMGTPAYMAPEQLQGTRQQIGPATDIYGLGGTLHFALLGRPPAGPSHGLKPAFSSPDPDQPRSGKPALAKDLRAILGKCLEADPALRYPSATALSEDLWRFLNGEAVQVRTPTAVLRCWHKSRRYLRITFTSALVITGLLAGWVLEGIYLDKVHEQRTELVRQFALETADLEKGAVLERILPIHDLRPANGLIRARLEELRLQMESRGPAAKGPGHLALARLHLLLGECQAAQKEAQQAWDGGFQGPEVAFVLASATGRGLLQTLLDNNSPTEQPSSAAQLEALFQRGRSLDLAGNDYHQALVAYLRKDYRGAAEAARGSLRIRPWDSDAACLEALSQCALAAQRLVSGDLAGAEQACLESMAKAQHFLAFAQSDPFAYHAYFLAARLHCALQQHRGELNLAALQALQQQCDRALLLDPDSPELQEDWLGLHFLSIQFHSERHQESIQELNTALVFLGTRLKEPLSAGLKNLRMLLYWRLAEMNLDQGDDPGPALSEALKGASRAPVLQWDALGQVLNFKARTEASRGLDPAATVATTLAFYPVQGRASWSSYEVAAEAWLIRAEWEQGHGLDASASLNQAATLSESALRANPTSASAYALNGLARMLELKITPGKGAILKMVARERLRRALELKAVGRLPVQLRQALREAENNINN